DKAVANWTYGYGCLTGDDRYAVLDYAVRDFPYPFLQRIDLTTGESERWRASATRPFELVDCRGPSGEVVYQSDQLSNRFLYAEEGSTPASESPTNRLRSVNSDFTVLAGSNRGAIATLDDEMRPFKLLAVELDADGEIGEVVETLEENGTRTLPGRWSPDGSAFAWVSPRPAAAHVWNARTNDRQSFALDYETLPYAALWSPDGDDLWLLSREQGDVSVSVLNLSTGTRSADDPIGSSRVYDLGHDGQSLIVQAEDDPLCIERLDLATRARSPLHCASAEDGSRLGARASQDYQHYLTYAVGESPIGAVLGILDAPTGAVRTVFRPQGYTLDTRMGWLRLAEPSTVTFAEFRDRAGSFDKLFRLDVESGNLSPMWQESLSLMNLNYYQIEAGGKMAVIRGRLKTDSWAGRVVRY
ncbi:MAG: hypothetical protein HKN29_15200, partial [Rhodothermales bacterium]|nr:hypothetical protein [Rhodothermales bacterium]